MMPESLYLMVLRKRTEKKSSEVSTVLIIDYYLLINPYVNVGSGTFRIVTERKRTVFVFRYFERTYGN